VKVYRLRFNDGMVAEKIFESKEEAEKIARLFVHDRPKIVIEEKAAK
jgi:hypothetical protein